MGYRVARTDRWLPAAICVRSMRRERRPKTLDDAVDVERREQSAEHADTTQQEISFGARG